MDKGIKEFKELFKALEDLAICGVKVAKDKKVGIDDLGALLELTPKLSEIVEGFKGFEELKLEAKDLDQAEILEIIGCVYSIVEKCEEAKKA